MHNIIIKNLNNLKRDENRGLYNKNLILDSQYHLVCDYLEKINYSLQDIEKELSKPADNSVLICILAYTCWIQESVCELKKIYKQYINDMADENGILTKNNEFLKAIRSLVLAHPFTTNRHNKFGFDGTVRCVDIRPNGKDITFPMVKECDKKYIDIDECALYKSQEVDYWLCVYDQNEYNNQFKQYIGISLSTICCIANDYVDYVYALDRHLSTTATNTHDVKCTTEPKYEA